MTFWNIVLVAEGMGKYILCVGKGLPLSLHPTAIGIIVEMTGSLSLGAATCLREGKPVVLRSLKISLCHILSIEEGMGKYIYTYRHAYTINLLENNSHKYLNTLIVLFLL